MAGWSGVSQLVAAQLELRGNAAWNDLTVVRWKQRLKSARKAMAASCDARIASETAIFGMPEVKLGIPSVVEAALLPMLVGWGRARHILLLGENFSARQAHAWNFVEQVTAPDQLNEAVETWIGQLLSCTPRAVRLQKALIRAW